jgi:hypothetical protein
MFMAIYPYIVLGVVKALISEREGKLHLVNKIPSWYRFLNSRHVVAS